MQLFFDPDLKPGVHQLREQEAVHAFRVLRKKVGDWLDLVDGRGGWYRGLVTSISKRDCLLDVELVRQEPPPAYTIILLVAPTKNIDRFEWVLEKATEIGIRRIIPFVSEHSERKRIRPDRLKRILESAMKQSLQAWKPTLAPLLDYSEALSTVTEVTQKYLAYLGDTNSPQLHQVALPGEDAVVAIGPEGGFSTNEAKIALDAGFTHVRLGPNRLRTETAAIAAVHTLNQINW